MGSSVSNFLDPFYLDIPYTGTTYQILLYSSSPSSIFLNAYSTVSGDVDARIDLPNPTTIPLGTAYDITFFTAAVGSQHCDIRNYSGTTLVALDFGTIGNPANRATLTLVQDIATSTKNWRYTYIGYSTGFGYGAA